MREPSLEEAHARLGGRHLVSDALEGRRESVRREQLVREDRLLLSIETGMIQVNACAYESRGIGSASLKGLGKKHIAVSNGLVPGGLTDHTNI